MENKKLKSGSGDVDRRRTRFNLLLFVVAGLGSLVVAWVAVSIFGRKQEARVPFVRVVEVDELTTDPEPWGHNWPHQYDGYLATGDPDSQGVSSALTQSKLDLYPWLKRLYAGYAFSIDYREARGHAYMLYDQGVTERVTKRSQAGACLHCHGSTSVMYRKAGLEAMGLPADDEALAASFNMEAVVRGFEEVSRKPYEEVLALLEEAPDGHGTLGGAHPVGCIDCHDPKSMAIRITRPGFMQGIAALAASEEPTAHLPSIERWRQGDRQSAYDPNADASRQEMRSFVCGQCHVEYYCANKDVLEFPWGKGLRMEQLEAHWEEKVFPDGSEFYDYAHGETGAKVYKVQHPEFELWSQGIHAQSGVSCADCHMPYSRQGATKLSSHNVRSPLENINIACQTCHNVPESDLRERVETIQGRTLTLMDRTAVAMTDMLDAILEAKAAGVADDQLAEVFTLQRKSMWRLDYISSENSRGFHAGQEAARILGESIDYSRQAQAMATRLRAGEAPNTDDLPIEPVLGVTGAEE
jgi:nitrite reductase (cytochrome c-552)